MQEGELEGMIDVMHEQEEMDWMVMELMTGEETSMRRRGRRKG